MFEFIWKKLILSGQSSPKLNLTVLKEQTVSTETTIIRVFLVAKAGKFKMKKFGPSVIW